VAYLGHVISASGVEMDA
jgi:hypothetical protein